MKTKEVEVWVDPMIETRDVGSYLITKDNLIMTNFNERDERKMVRAKLIIEIPEKKISITESEWEDARDLWDTSDTVAMNLTRIQEKLFGTQGDG